MIDICSPLNHKRQVGECVYDMSGDCEGDLGAMPSTAARFQVAVIQVSMATQQFPSSVKI
jgi:hypothetical protein